MNGNFPTPLPHRALYMVKVLLARFQVFFLATVLLEQFKEPKAMVTALSEMLTALSERLTVKVLLEQFQALSMVTALSEMLTALSERLMVKVLLEQFQVFSMVTALSEMLMALSDQVTALA